MSDPQRYTLALPEISYGMDESNKGEYVLWRDYKRLKAEVERLRASSFVTAVPVEEYEKLKAEVERLRKVFEITERLMLRDGEYEAAKVGTYANLKAAVERLRKAGDAMHQAIKVSDPTLDWAIECWNAAKEGRPNE